MRRYIKLATVLVVLVTTIAFAAYSVSNYNEQGGARTVIGGSLDVVSGGDLDIESGGALKIAGTEMTASAAELNVGDGVTAGTVTADKAVVVDASKDIGTFGAVTVTSLLLGNGQTLSGAVDNRIEWTENDETFGLIFGTNTITVATDSGVDTVDFNDIDIHLTDDSDLIFGTGSDFVLDSDTANTLDIIPNATDETAAFNVGADATGIDVTFFGATAGSHLFWDASEEAFRTFSDNAGFALYTVDDAKNSTVTMYRRRGVIGTPTVVEDGDLLGQMQFSGYDGDSDSAGARIRAYVDTTPGDSDMPTRLDFLTSADGSATPALRLRLDSDGSVDIPTDGTLELENGQSLSGAVDNRIEWTENSETFGYIFDTNKIELATDSGVDTLDFNDIDALEDIASIDTGTTAYLTLTTNSLTNKYAYMPISQGVTAATEVIIGAPGYPLICTGLEGGANEAGSTEGYTALGDAADILLFGIQLPSTFINTGAVGDLVLELDLHEQAEEECNLDVRIFEYGNTTPIITDTILITNGAARAWSGLVTLSTGIGADSDIDADDTLVIELTATGDTDDVNVYGARISYNVGAEATH